jgi:GTP-binding protein SAR1
MFIIDWFKSLLSQFGLAQKKGKIIFLGLDNAGKTTLLHVMRDDRVAAHQPTFHPQNDELVIEGCKFRTFDLGGHQAARMIWSEYFSNVDGIIYMVDASDPRRFHESAEELRQLFESPELANVPIAVLGNKIDIPNAASEDDLRSAFGLQAHLTYGRQGGKRDSAVRPVEVFMCSVVRRLGFKEAFKWIAQFLQNK